MQQAVQIQTIINEAQEKKKLTFEEFLASRPEWPKNRPPVTLEEMEEAIVKGAIDSADL